MLNSIWLNATNLVDRYIGGLEAAFGMSDIDNFSTGALATSRRWYVHHYTHPDRGYSTKWVFFIFWRPYVRNQRSTRLVTTP
jgi:hypothetical protein